MAFDPFDLTIDLTSQSVLEVLGERAYLRVLVLALRLNEKPIVQRVYEGVPRNDVRLVARQMPVVYIPALLQFIAEHLERGPHVEFDLIWIHATERMLFISLMLSIAQPSPWCIPCPDPHSTWPGDH